MEQHLGVCVIVRRDQKILLGKRKNSYKAGSFGMPGGRIEVGESLVVAAKRELEEETGIVGIDPAYVGVVRESQGDYDFIHFVFVIELDSQEPRLCEPDKCEEWLWFSLDTLPQEMLAGHRAGIELLTDGSTQLADLHQ